MYTVEALIDPNFPNGQADPEEIADAGLIAATSDQGGTANYVGVVFEDAVFKSAVPRGSDTVFLAVNNFGHTAGARGAHADPFVAVTSDGTSLADVPLAAPAGTISTAVGINDVHQVIGWDTSDARGFLMDRGVISRIPPPPGHTGSAPRAINAIGEIVGTTDTGGFVFKGGASRLLGDFTPEDINNRGIACGATSAGVPALCGTRQTPLVVLERPLPAGLTNGILYGVNDAGVAVGQAWKTLAASAAFIVDGDMSLDLNTLVETPGWDLITAKGINNAGQIVGLGWNNRRLMGYLASPIRTRPPFQLQHIPELIAILLGGITVDGGGIAVVGGKPRPVDPWGPLRSLSPDKRDTVLALALDEAAAQISDPVARASIRRALTRAAARGARALERAAHARTERASTGAHETGLKAQLLKAIEGRRRSK